MASPGFGLAPAIKRETGERGQDNDCCFCHLHDLPLPTPRAKVKITEPCAANPLGRGHAPDLQNGSAMPGALPAERSTHGHRTPDTGMIPSGSIRRPD